MINFTGPILKRRMIGFQVWRNNICLTSLCDGDGRKQAGESVRGGYLAFGVDSLHCAREES